MAILSSSVRVAITSLSWQHDDRIINYSHVMKCQLSLVHDTR